jgi:CBS domain-containing protein
MKTIQIKNLDTEKSNHYRIFPADMSLDQLIKDLAADDSLRGVFVVDGTRRLIGVLNRRNLLDWVRIQLGIPLQLDTLVLATVRRIVSAGKVGDLLESGSEVAAVTMEDCLADALDKMTKFNLVDIPVINEAGQVIGDLSISEVLSYVLEHQDIQSDH